MNLIIIIIIILTILLIVSYYNKDAMFLLFFTPILGTLWYLKIDNDYNNSEYIMDAKEIMIVGSSDEQIKVLEDENKKILEYIKRYDNMIDLDNKISNFEEMNKYFMLKDNIADPKILILLEQYYKKITKDIINKPKNNIKPPSKQQINIINSVISEIDKLQLINKESINYLIHYINTMVAINKENDPMSNYLELYIRYDKYIKKWNNKLYNSNNIKIFNVLTKNKIESTSSNKQLYYLMAMQKSIRDDEITQLDSNKIIETCNSIITNIKDSSLDDKNLVIQFNKEIYSLFIQYHVNINKINNIKENVYKDLSISVYNKVLKELQQSINEKLKNEDIKIKFDLTLKELLNKKKQDHISNNNIPSNLLLDIKKFDKIKLNKKLKMAYDDFESNNKYNDILDTMSMIQILIKKYEKLAFVPFSHNLSLSLSLSLSLCSEGIWLPSLGSLSLLPGLC